MNKEMHTIYGVGIVLAHKENLLAVTQAV